MTRYKHPHETLNIIDNTEIFPESSANTGAIVLAAFVSDKGIDGEIFDLNDPKQVLMDYGYPDLKFHGQAYLNVLKHLEGGGVVKGMRITAKNATYANLVVGLWVNVVESQKQDSNGNPLYLTPAGIETTISTGNTPIMIKTAKVKLTAQNINSLKTTSEDLEVMLRSLQVTDPLKGTFFPLYVFASRGKGKYGNTFRVRLTPNSVRDKDTNHRNYIFELLVNENGLNKVEVPLNVSNYVNARTVQKTSEYIEDVLKRNIYPVKMYAIDDYYYTITDMLLPVIQQSRPEIRTEQIDFIFFRDHLTKVQYPNVEIEADSINLSTLEGFPLATGDDAEFDRSNLSRWDAIYERYEEAFEGKIDETILDPKKHPAHVMLDANLPYEVKQSMTNLQYGRKDFHLLLDAGMPNTLLDAKNWRTSEIVVDESNVSLHPMWFSTYDKYTGKDINVTATYAYACKLAKHFKTRGNHIPLAGEEVFLNDIINPGSLRPRLTRPEDKTEFVELRLNYIEEEYGKLMFATQLTSQSKNTDLIEMNNLFILNDVKRDVLALGPTMRYKPNETEEDFKEFNRMLNSRLEKYADVKCKVIYGEVTRGTDVNNPRAIKTKVYIGFKTYSEINDIEIEINRY